MSLDSKELFLLEAWVADNPGSRMFLRLAQAYLDAGRPQDAVPVLRRGLVMNPQLIQARQLLAKSLRALGQHEEAEAELVAAVSELASHSSVFYDLADLWDEMGLTQPAVQAREVAEALDLGLDREAPPEPQAAPAPTDQPRAVPEREEDPGSAAWEDAAPEPPAPPRPRVVPKAAPAPDPAPEPEPEPEVPPPAPSEPKAQVDMALAKLRALRQAAQTRADRG